MLRKFGYLTVLAAANGIPRPILTMHCVYSVLWHTTSEVGIDEF